MEIDTAWDIIEKVLQDRLPEVAETLRAPVAEGALDRLRMTTGQELPSDFVASLRRHDGQDNPSRLLGLFDHHTLLSVDEMIEASDIRVDALGDDIHELYEWMVPDKVRTVMNCRGWAQFTDAEGDGYALDLDPLPAGEAGQIIYLPVDGPTPAPEFGSYREWLSSFAEKLDAGHFDIDAHGLWLTP